MTERLQEHPMIRWLWLVVAVLVAAIVVVNILLGT
jgi:hypothetical protein